MKTENLEELEEMRKEFESADALLSSPSKKSGTYKLYFILLKLLMNIKIFYVMQSFLK